MKLEGQQQEIFQHIMSVLVEEFELDKESLQPDTHLFDDLELDSLDAVDLVVILEKTYGFRAKEERMKEIRTIFDVVLFIEEAQKLVESQKVV